MQQQKWPGLPEELRKLADPHTTVQLNNIQQLSRSKLHFVDTLYVYICVTTFIIVTIIIIFLSMYVCIHVCLPMCACLDACGYTCICLCICMCEWVHLYEWICDMYLHVCVYNFVCVSVSFFGWEFRATLDYSWSEKSSLHSDGLGFLSDNTFMFVMSLVTLVGYLQVHLHHILSI